MTQARLCAIDNNEDNGGVTYVGYTREDIYNQYEKRDITLNGVITLNTKRIIEVVGRFESGESFNAYCTRMWRTWKDKRDNLVTLKGIEKLTIHPMEFLVDAETEE